MSPAPAGLIPGVKTVIAVASGKGGVGKSTVSAQLALALAARGRKVGLMDADVYGPSIPTILGIHDKPLQKDGRILPVMSHGIKVISMGFFIPENEAVIWRGPMLHKMVNDFLAVVDWGELDTLVVDLPPGTGDIQLSLCQTIPITGAVIVSTPQNVAWNVAQKAIVMFDKLNAPVLGIVENMSGPVFGSGGARRAAELLEIPFLGEIALDARIRESGDRGEPAPPKDFDAIAGRLLDVLAHPKGGGRPAPVSYGAPGLPQIEITWSDGQKTSYDTRGLRLACPCAGCVNELTGERTVKSEKLPPTLFALSFVTIGRYALKVSWSDGHDTGLYGFEYLRKLASPAVVK